MIHLKDALNTRLTEDFFINVIYVCSNRKHLVFGIRGPAQMEELPFKYWDQRDLDSDLLMIEKKIDGDEDGDVKIKGFGT